MKLSNLFFAILICSSVTNGFTTSRTGKTQGIKFTKRYARPDKRQMNGALRKRDYLTNGYVSYTAVLEVGTPPQEVEVYIDTGSSDLWFQTPQSLQCSISGAYSNYTSCETLGVPFFVPTDSSSIHYTNEKFVMSYDSGYEVTDGRMASDHVTIGDLSVKNQSFGIAFRSNTQDDSILGLGLEALEYSSTKYPTLLTSMYSEGVIDEKLYLIYLDSQFADGGEITFGEVDYSKFSGELVAHDLVSKTEFFIQSEGINFDGVDILGSAQMLIDTGTTAMSVPTDTLRAMVDFFNATYNDDYGHYSVICKDFNTSAPDLIFKFGKQEIHIAPNEYLMNYNIGSNGETEPAQDDKGNDICFLGLDTGDAVILGDTFIRSVYAVFDLDKLQISLAKAAWISDDSTQSFHSDSSTALISTFSPLNNSITSFSTSLLTSISSPIVTTSRSSSRSIESSLLLKSAQREPSIAPSQLNALSMGTLRSTDITKSTYTTTTFGPSHATVVSLTTDKTGKSRSYLLEEGSTTALDVRSSIADTVIGEGRSSSDVIIASATNTVINSKISPTLSSIVSGAINLTTSSATPTYTSATIFVFENSAERQVVGNLIGLFQKLLDLIA